MFCYFLELKNPFKAKNRSVMKGLTNTYNMLMDLQGNGGKFEFPDALPVCYTNILTTKFDSNNDTM